MNTPNQPALTLTAALEAVELAELLVCVALVVALVVAAEDPPVPVDVGAAVAPARGAVVWPSI